jgi:hypothetical protein
MTLLSKNINKKSFLLLGIVCIFILVIFYIFTFFIKKRENFTWNKKSKHDFIDIERTINQQKIFDVDKIEEQASQEEVNYFNKNGIWQWSQKTQKLYKDAVTKNPFIKTLAKDAVHDAMKIYNESAILQILSQQSKEGQFLLSGILVSPANSINSKEQLPSGYGSFAYTSGLINNKTKDVIKCNTNGELERITFNGKGSGSYGEQKKKISILNYKDLESIIPGFTFVKEPCNPCVPYNKIPDYSCPFKIQVKKNNSISEIWKYLWNI